MARQYLFFTIMYNTEHAHDRSQGCLSYFNIFCFTLPAQQFNNVLFRHILEFALLEKCLKAPVAGALWYRFFEPVP